MGGAGIVMVEATAVVPEGRISAGDLGFWSDEHTPAYKRIAEFISSQGAIPAIQLAHAGRKANYFTPFAGKSGSVPLAEGGWETFGPSAVPFSSTTQTPIELDLDGIEKVISSWVAATKRALESGFKIIEIHAAHGYLLHQFLSPLSNLRTDAFGGNLENRMRLLLQVAAEVRATVPENLPVFVRISATDWVEGGWDIEQSVALCHELNKLGVDLIDVSSGGTVPNAVIPVEPGYQVPLADRIRSEVPIKTGAVGLITDAHQAESILQDGKADIVFLAREYLRDPYWAIHAALALGDEPSWPLQYGYAVQRRR